MRILDIIELVKRSASLKNGDEVILTDDVGYYLPESGYKTIIYFQGYKAIIYDEYPGLDIYNIKVMYNSIPRILYGIKREQLKPL